MAIIPMKPILDAAFANQWAAPALNFNELMQLQAYMGMAYLTKSPIVLQSSMGSRKFTGYLGPEEKELLSLDGLPREIIDELNSGLEDLFGAKRVDPTYGAGLSIDFITAMDGRLAAIFGYDLPMSVTLDHGPSILECTNAMDMGFPSVMIDGSLDYDVTLEDGSHPVRSFEDNMRVTAAVVEYAHRIGCSVEAELGTLGGIEGGTKASKVQLTDPKQAREFAEKVAYDCLACAIGTSHGAYKFTSAESRELRIDLVSQIRDATGRPLVMHGSSSVPEASSRRINEYPGVHKVGNTLEVRGYWEGNYGQDAIETRVYDLTNPGDMARFGVDMQTHSCLKPSFGVLPEQRVEAIANGIAKVNIDTDGRMEFDGRFRGYSAAHPEVFDQRKPLNAGRLGLAFIAAQVMYEFGAAGKMCQVEIVGKEEMARRYAA